MLLNLHYKTVSTALYTYCTDTHTCSKEKPRVFNSVPINTFTATGDENGSWFITTSGASALCPTTTTGGAPGGGFTPPFSIPDTCDTGGRGRTRYAIPVSEVVR